MQTNELRKYRRGNVTRPYGDPHGPLVTILRVEKTGARQVLLRAVVIGHVNARKGWRVYRNGETVSWWCEGVPT